VVGVTRYAGECAVCARPEGEQEEINEAIRAGARSNRLKWIFPELRIRDFRQHRRQCMKPRKGAS
jgi:hypothetical protein